MSGIEVIYRQANPPEAPTARWRGFKQETVVLKSGSINGTDQTPGARPLTCDIVLERDVEVVLRDGTIIYTDVFRPVTDDRVPAIMAWSPYGKQGGFWQLDLFPRRAGVPVDAVSGLQKWEAPDPGYWCAHGFAIVNPDARGAFESNGDIEVFSPQEGRDGADVIEWIAQQDWSSGKVGLAGNSWLAVSQWFIAAQQPPHLSAFAPWEGFTDVYRDLVAMGGIPDPVFTEGILQNNYGRNKIEDVIAMIEKYPKFNDYWASKAVNASKISIPAYVVASYTNALHTRGTLAGYASLNPDKTWLRIHNSMEWPDFYEHQDDLRRFYDYTLKGVDNGWQDTPKVRMAILDPGHTDLVDIPQPSFPPPQVQPTAFFLDCQTKSITRSAISTASSTSYEADTGVATFEADLGDMTLAGPMKLRLWIESPDHDEMDLFVGVQKVGTNGAVLVPDFMPDVPSPGARGQLRASHRKLSEDLSRPLVPRHTHDAPEPLTPGKVVAVDIEIWPMAMRWHAGEKLRVVVAGHELQVPIVPRLPPRPTNNAGPHIIHSGGAYDSQLLVPLLLDDVSSER
jgi:predicted acyl esterase